MNIEQILKDHKLWFESGGKEGARADLGGADLRGVDLSCADLRNANFKGADLRWVNFKGADLKWVNFKGADLSCANLENANLRNTKGNDKEIKNIENNIYHIVYTKKSLLIGCENHLIEEWFKFDDETIEKMDVDALEWWNEYKDGIFKHIKENPAT